MAGDCLIQVKFDRFGIATLIFIFIFAVLIVTNANIGVTWDEPAYFAASESYMSWFDQAFSLPEVALQQDMITNAWQINKEHPPMDKICSGLIWSITRNFIDGISAHRLGNMLLSAILAGLLFLWMRDVYGVTAGLVAVGALFTMPRFFFHAHLAALDVPAAFSVFITTYLFWKTMDRKHWAWRLLLGVVWGLALATKINALFVPVTLGLWLICFKRDLRLFLRLVIMGVSAIPVFFMVWPWLYVDTIKRIFEYIGFITTDHWQIGQYYLGNFYMPPPWHFGFVMIWAVVPLGLTFLYFLGIVRAIKWKQDQALGLLLFLSALVPILAISTGQSMVYDNDRLMMVSFPFLAALAGIGFVWLISGLKKLTHKKNSIILSRVGYGVIILLAFIPQLVTMVKLYPHFLSYYSQGVNGLVGATRKGLESTYWCETYQLALPIINDQAQAGDRIWADPWSHDVLIYYQMAGLLRDDLVIIAEVDVESVFGPDAPMARRYPMSAADWWIFQHRQTTLGDQGKNNPIMSELSKHEVVYKYSFDGVPIMTLYK